MSTTPTQQIEHIPAVSRPPLDPAHAAVVAERKADAGVGRPSKKPTRDALVALQYKGMEGLQASVIARLKAAVEDPKDPLHALAMGKLTDRLVPQAFWDSLAKQEFATEAEEKNRAPSVHITINAGAAPKPEVDVVSEQ